MLLGVAFEVLRSPFQAQRLSFPPACASRCRSLSHFSSTVSAVCCHAFCHDGNGLNLETVSQFQLSAFFYKSHCGHGVSAQ